MKSGWGGHLQPGVLAFGYVKITTPASLSATSSARVVLFPSLVSNSPPNLARSIVEPTAGMPEEPPLELAAGASATGAGTGVPLALAAPVDFFFAGAGGATGGVLRLRSSTIAGYATDQWETGELALAIGDCGYKLGC